VACGRKVPEQYVPAEDDLREMSSPEEASQGPVAKYQDASRVQEEGSSADDESSDQEQGSSAQELKMPTEPQEWPQLTQSKALDSLTVATLREWLNLCGQPTNGNKSQVIKRFIEHAAQGHDSAEEKGRIGARTALQIIYALQHHKLPVASTAEARRTELAQFLANQTSSDSGAAKQDGQSVLTPGEIQKKAVTWKKRGKDNARKQLQALLAQGDLTHEATQQVHEELAKLNATRGQKVDGKQGGRGGRQ
jgi:hypothetical protein